MNLTIEIPDHVGAALKSAAQTKGISAARYASRIIEASFAPAMERDSAGAPFESGYGMWAKYGPAPSADEIDENRRDMFRTLA